jgi:photosystem II stability/assembly factor-like uncharacterized protein
MGARIRRTMFIACAATLAVMALPAAALARPMQGPARSTVDSAPGVHTAGQSDVQIQDVGGATVQMSRRTQSSFSGVTCVSPGQAWVSGTDNSIYRTTDGGAHWTQLSTPLPSAEEVTDIEFVSSTTGWAIGANNAIMRSTNGGTTWSSKDYLASLYPPYLVKLSAVDATHAWIGGYYLTGEWRQYYHNVVLRTSDGTTWQAAAALMADGSTGWGVVGIDFANRDRGWGVTAGGGFIYTWNGGAVWTPPIDMEGVSTFSDVSFADANNGWAVGEDASSYGSGNGLILHTSDGRTWYRQATNVAGLSPLPSVRAVCAVSPSVAWAACSGGYILHTTDGGSTWTYFHPVTADLNAVAFATADTGWVVGDNGTIVHYGPPYKAAKPVISKLSPSSGYVRRVVTLTGRGFGATRGKGFVKFGPRKVGFYIDWSDTRIRVMVPVSTPKGAVKVTVATANGTSNFKRFVRM